MITLTATIELIGEDKGKINSLTINTPKNNISSEIGAILGSRKGGSNPFIIGASKVGEKTAYFDKVDYYIGKELSDSNGSFNKPYIFQISGTNVQAITIVFDTYNNQHPNTILLDGKTYVDDDPIFTISNLPNLSDFTLVIDNWNTPNYPLRVQSMYVTLEIKIDNNNLINLSRTLFDRADISKPSYGIISNSGSIEFNDTNGEIKDYAEQLLLQAGLNIKLSINNTNIKKENVIGKYYTNDWNYDEYNKVVRVSFKDELEEWQDIIIPGIGFNPRIDKPINFTQLYIFLYNKTPKKYPMKNIYTLDEQTQYVLDNTYIKYPILKRGSLWAGWTKLCEACQLQIYKEPNGIITCKYNGGR